MSSAPHPRSRRAEWLALLGPLGHSRKRLLALVLAAALTAAVIIGGLLNLRIDTRPEAFLPASDPAVVQADKAAQEFGGDPIVVLLESAQPAGLFAQDQLPKLVELEGRLSQLPDVAAVFGPGTSLNQLAGASQNLVARISGERDGLMAAAEQKARAAGADETQVQRARQQSVAEFDIHYGGLLARGLPTGLPTMHNPRFVQNLVFDPDGGPRTRWKIMVPTPTTVAISIRPRADIDQGAVEGLDRAVRQAVNAAALPISKVTVSGAPALAAALGHQVRTESPYLGALALILIGACYLFLPWTARLRDRVAPLACTLGASALVLAGFGWADHPLSLGVIAFLPILIGTGSDFPAYLLSGIRHRRVAIAAVASAAGFAALAVSSLPFVRDLGIALGAGLLIAFGIAALLRVGTSFYSAEDAQTPPDTAPASDTDLPTRPDRPKGSAGSAKRGPLAVMAVVSAVALGGWVLLPQLPIQAQPDVLAGGIPAVSDAQHVEQVLGSSGEIQLILRGPNVVTPETLAWMHSAEEAVIVSYGDKLRPIASLPDLLDFLGPRPTQEEIDGGMSTLPAYLTGAVVSFDYHAAVIRLGVRLQDLHDQQRLLADLARSLPAPPPAYQAQIVGLPVAGARAYQLLSDDRYLSNSLGIILAGLVLVVGLGRTRYLAPKAVLAAVLATGWGLAATWLLGLSLTPLTVALGSLSTATACEFTVLIDTGRGHYATRRTVGVAALAASLGYLALTASHLAILRHFGLLLAATVLLSLLAAHLVVRALPRGPTHSEETAPTWAPPRKVRELAYTVAQAGRKRSPRVTRNEVSI
jgi:predicted RND superfamily exporter protein